MLEIQLDIAGYAIDARRFGEVWNVYQLGAAADYDFWFQGRRKPPKTLLASYPRWCEPVSGLFARCLALSKTAVPTERVGPWKFLRLRLGIRPGGGRDYRPLTQVTARARDHELAVVTTTETIRSAHQAAARGRYNDLWDLAEHVLRISAFGFDQLPEAKALDVPIRSDGRQYFVCLRDIPEPAHSVFLRNMSGSARPTIAGYPDAVYPWDWTDFLSGQR